MLRVPMNKSHLKRTLRLLYGFTQTTPKDQKLDPAWDRSVAIFPGMVAMKTKGDLVTLINATGVPMGLFGSYIGGDGIDEIAEQGVNSVPVWVMGSEAEFEVLAPAFDTALTWTDPADGTRLKVHAQTAGATRGKLVPAGTAGASAQPIGHLVRVDSASKIVIGGLRGTV